MDGWGLTAF